MKRTATAKKPFLRSLADVVERNEVQIYSTIAAMLFALNGFWFSVNIGLGVLDICLAVLFFALSLRSSNQLILENRRLLKLNETLSTTKAESKIELGEYFTFILESLFNDKLGFKQTERISLFEYARCGFRLIAQFSANPE